MHWIVLSYSLPSKSQSSPRVALWRRLRRLGAVSPKNGMHVLPEREECAEAFAWLSQEVQQLGGEALVMHVQHFEGLDDAQLVELFSQARAEEYAELLAEGQTLLAELKTDLAPEKLRQGRETLARLRKRQAEIAGVDFFGCPVASELAAILALVEQRLHPEEDTPLPAAGLADYQGRRWVTRPRPHIDRLACAWLIRRFVDPDAEIRYSHRPEPDEIAFDTQGGHFSHRGNLCTFEVMVDAFRLQVPGLAAVAEIVHALDLRDGLYERPEAAGIEAVLRGWLLCDLSDAELERMGGTLFEGLLREFGRKSSLV